MRYLARISYDGSEFLGFQRLNNGRGVQNVLENVLSKIDNDLVVVKGAGRTDALVHACDQCIHFDLHHEIPLEKLKYSMNQMLPAFISVNSISLVPSSFHARHSVVEKTYVYKVYVGTKNPFVTRYSYSVTYPLCYEKMKEGCSLFLGIHDFHNFVSSKRESYVSQITSFQVYKQEDYYIFEVKGKSFYRYMVRSLVGAILDLGRGKITCTSILDALNYPSLEKRFFVAPACGLYLMEIKY